MTARCQNVKLVVILCAELLIATARQYKIMSVLPQKTARGHAMWDGGRRHATRLDKMAHSPVTSLRRKAATVTGTWVINQYVWYRASVCNGYFHINISYGYDS